MKKLDTRKQRITVGILCVISLLIIVYIGGVIYFNNHFSFGTKINGVNVSGKTVEEVQSSIENEISNYILVLEERNDIKEEIKASDIELKYDGSDRIREIKDSQNKYSWFLSIFESKDDNIYKAVTFNEGLLKDKVKNLGAITSKDIVSPKDASFKYNNGSFDIVQEIYGNKVNEDILYEKIKDAVIEGKEILNLDNEGCYVNPKFISSSDEVKAAKEGLNKALQAKITYEIFGNNEYLDSSKISSWLSVNDNMEVIIDGQKAKNYIDELAYKYNTVNKSREFLTSTGAVVQVPKGNYGWRIDTSAEKDKLISDIKEGNEVTREPIYKQKGAVKGLKDYGNTYAEINLTKQHIWFYKDGALITEGDIVTGNVANKWDTPAGIYSLNYKEKNATLKGEDYETKVNYWMPFNGGIGLHDALWRSEFGKEIYLQGGSHGCVNAPFEVAQSVFDNIKPGDPVIVYTE